MRNLRPILRNLAIASFVAASQGALAMESIHVLKSPTCGCCVAWGTYLRTEGFSVTERDVPEEMLSQAKTEAGLKPGQTSCHTASMDGYVLEGHVPAREIRRLMSERPDAIGLTVPDMPYGSPGMGEPGPDADPYDVLLVKKDGTTEVYASYPEK